MKKILLFLALIPGLACAQTVGKTSTEQYKASFETAIDISQFLDYEGPQIPIQILKAGISEEMYEMYPELKEKKDRVDDALHATRAAVEEGIVAGGGIALMKATGGIEVEIENEDQGLGVNIIKKACFAPFKAIVENAGKNAEAIYDKIGGEDYGYDARNNKYVNMFEAGIIDPTKVTRTALELATSVAATLLTTECIISINPEDKKKDEAPAYPY